MCFIMHTLLNNEDLMFRCIQVTDVKGGIIYGQGLWLCYSDSYSISVLDMKIEQQEMKD